MTPYTKVTAGALAGALSVLLVWILGLLGVSVPGEAAAAFTTIFTFAVSWIVPETSGT